ncbi:hypothetical protein SCP_1300560 [Sparassis crispa]|uniref:Uncharacterized protein n=1 Tax=Sparassis crispa TaxID=139825 RepID=A0A401H1D5_9APHY|nr:hypothetical protein SCP_1300560 [Sparassis crispa]GBE88241.1 hypothetical protein SCP_1300560 [Sparassis crispa]
MPTPRPSPRRPSGPAGPSIRPSDCRVTVKIDENAKTDYPTVFKTIDVKVRYPRGKEVASLRAVQIDRRIACEGRFHQVMDSDMEDRDELEMMGRVLFTKYGEVRPWIVEDEQLKGTGCWGNELSDGMLIYILSVRVPDEASRGRGLGSLALRSLLRSEHVQKDDIILAWPTLHDQSQHDEETKNLSSFYHKNDFRRVGVEEKEEYARKYPLHNKIFCATKEDIEQIIRATFLQNPLSIRRQDDEGFTPIHRAAEAHNLIATNILLELGVQEDLVKRDNARLRTPLMLCTDQLRLTRELQETRHRRWLGYSYSGLRVEAMLKRAMGQYAGTDDEYVQKNSWGCTCGQCVGGWLSPKIRYALEACAECLYDSLLEMQKCIFVDGQPITEQSILTNEGLPYIPPRLRSRIDVVFYFGFRVIFGAIGQVIQEIEDASNPTAEQIQERILRKVHGDLPWTNSFELQPVEMDAVMYYLSKGGRISYALDCVIAGVPSEFEMDDMYEGVHEFFGIKETEREGRDPELDELERKRKALPACANDREFLLVRHRMGLERMGPYGDHER